MKNFLFSLLMVASLAFLCGCSDSSIEYITLSDLSSKTTSTPIACDFHVKDAYITAVSGNEVLVEDKTMAARITLQKSNPDLKAGTAVSAHITGQSATVGGALEITAAQIDGVSASETKDLPFVEVTIAQINADPSAYAHKRVLVKDITFAEHFNGKVGDKARIVQKGKVGTVMAAAAEYYAIAGNQGDIYVYPGDGVLYVYTDIEFEEHEVISPFTQKTVYGVYTVGEQASEKIVYEAGVDQIACGKNEQGRFSRIQSYAKERVLCLILPTSKIAQGNFIFVSLKSAGYGLSDVSNQEMFVEKLTSDKMWLMDYNTGTGYIIAYEK